LVGGDFYWHKKCNNGDFRFICTFAWRLNGVRKNGVDMRRKL
jgi:hypothetical protein